MKELISAIATAQGKGGVAIVRVSGEGAWELARKMFSCRGEYSPNRMYAGRIDCGEFSDYGLLVCFRAPHSFTGEDVAEFHLHGGTEIARGALKRTLELGARPAEAGEFTRRAFLNGKLSLAAAEGMGEMIDAQSAAQARAGFLLYTEKLTAEGKRLQDCVRQCLAEVDADVDFPEEDLSAGTRSAVQAEIEAALSGLDALLKQYRAGKKIKSGVNVAICGRPNAGKSSLLNALLGYDRAIVSAQEGTTRDIVEGSIELHGVLFRLTDTAGLHEGKDEVEREGIRRAEQAMRAADLVLWLKEEEPVPLPEGTPVLLVGAKCDLVRREGCDLLVSARTGEGIDRLKERMYECGFGRENDGAFLLEERHYAALTEAKEALLSASARVAEGAPSEIYAEDLNRAYRSLGLISGETATEEIVGEIFSKFCVGK